MIIGYTSGIFDLFHTGHLNILKKAKENCDYLIIGLASNQYCKNAKGFYPIIDYNQRKTIIKSIKYVDKVIKRNDSTYPNTKIDIAFKGTDWKNSNRGFKLEKYLKKKNIKLKYIPYTKTISSTIIKRRIK
jgi:glycerol-3-phosphate cytidylyltransferase